MSDILNQFKINSQKSLEFLQEELKSIRTGKANPSLLENLIVETYGGQSRLRLLELSTIITEGSSALSVTPYDLSTLPDIEKAILKSSLGITPAVQGNRIIARIPPLSQEQREKFAKLVSQKSEERKNIIRGLRDDTRKKIKQLFEKKEISEDEKYKMEKEIDSETQKIMESIQQIKDKKEKDIMEI